MLRIYGRIFDIDIRKWAFGCPLNDTDGPERVLRPFESSVNNWLQVLPASHEVFPGSALPRAAWAAGVMRGR
jgi:hypothetical protein